MRNDGGQSALLGSPLLVDLEHLGGKERRALGSREGCEAGVREQDQIEVMADSEALVVRRQIQRKFMKKKESPLPPFCHQEIDGQ